MFTVEVRIQTGRVVVTIKNGDETVVVIVPKSILTLTTSPPKTPGGFTLDWLG